MTAKRGEMWRKRIDLPAYQVAEAARYARTTPQTIGNWQRVRVGANGAIGPRDHGVGLSYLQLIEVGVVAAMRKSGVRLPKIRQARDYLSREFGSEYPFAQYRFKTDGKDILMDYDQIAGTSAKDKLLVVSEGGQLAWNRILSNLLKEFDYADEDEVVRAWRVAGVDSAIMIDPRVAFGAPQINGIATWVLKERWQSGESVKDIADDYCLEAPLVFAALEFEGVDVDPDRPNQWVH